MTASVGGSGISISTRAGVTLASDAVVTVRARAIGSPTMTYSGLMVFPLCGVGAEHGERAKVLQGNLTRPDRFRTASDGVFSAGRVRWPAQPELPVLDMQVVTCI